MKRDDYINKDIIYEKYIKIETGKDIFKNIKSKIELQKAAYNYLLNGNKNFKKIKDEIDNKKITFIRISAREYVYGRNNSKLQNNQYKEKLKAAPSIDDLIQKSTLKYHSPLVHDNKLFPNGFNNYQGILCIDNDIFRYIVRIGKSKRNESIFYDLSLELIAQKKKTITKYLEN